MRVGLYLALDCDPAPRLLLVLAAAEVLASLRLVPCCLLRLAAGYAAGPCQACRVSLDRASCHSVCQLDVGRVPRCGRLPPKATMRAVQAGPAMAMGTQMRRGEAWRALTLDGERDRPKEESWGTGLECAACVRGARQQGLAHHLDGVLCLRPSPARPSVRRGRARHSAHGLLHHCHAGLSHICCGGLPRRHHHASCGGGHACGGCGACLACPCNGGETSARASH